jgi:hypothetical protein
LLAVRASGERPAAAASAVRVTAAASRADFLAGVGRVRGLDTTRLTAATAGVREEVEPGGGAAVSSCSTV